MDALIDAVPGGWLGMVLVLLLVGPPTLLSAFATKLPGFLGAGARKWQGRQISAVNRVQELEKSIDDAVDRRVRVRLQEFEQFETDWREMRKDIEVLRADRDLAYEYIAFIAGWYRSLNIFAREQGWVFPPPPYMTFHEYRATMHGGGTETEDGDHDPSIP